MLLRVYVSKIRIFYTRTSTSAVSHYATLSESASGVTVSSGGGSTSSVGVHSGMSSVGLPTICFGDISGECEH